MLAQTQRQHVVVLKDVLLEGIQVLTLEEHFGYLLLDRVCVPDRDDALADVEAPLPPPLLHLLGPRRLYRHSEADREQA